MESNVFNLRKAVVAGCLAGLVLCGGTAASSTEAIAATSQDNPLAAIAKGDASAEPLVKDGVFTISTKEFAERMDSAYFVISVIATGTHDGFAGYSADLIRGTDGSKLNLSITKDSELQGLAAFSRPGQDTGWVKYADKNKTETFSSVTFAIPSATSTDCLSSTMMAAISASNPTISIEHAAEIAVGLLDGLQSNALSGNFSYTVKENNIAYTLVFSDDEDAWGFMVSA